MAEWIKLYTLFLLLVFLCVPYSAVADIGSLDYTEDAHRTVLRRINTFQTLGSGLSGHATQFETYFGKAKNKAGYTAEPKVTLLECDPDKSVSVYTCKKHVIAHEWFIGTAEVPLQKFTYDVSITFKPENYYVLVFDEKNSRGSHRLAGHTSDTHAGGECSVGYSSPGLAACGNNGGANDGTNDPILDIAFQFKGSVEMLPEDPAPVVEGTPIIFLPGIFGSRLYDATNKEVPEKLWDGFAGEKMRGLAMDSEGKSLRPIRVGSMLTQFEAGYIKVADIYKSLQEHFQCGTDSTRSPLFAEKIPGNDYANCPSAFVSYPYDWRHDVFDVIDEGTTYTSGDTVYLVDLVETLAGKTSGKVHILAHSNGGLLAKALLVRLEEQGKEHLVDKVVLVGSPQLGTPKTIAAMLHGYEQGQFGGLIKKESVSRLLSLNSPGAYSLLPSEVFIENNDPVVLFDDSPGVTSYRKIFGKAIDSYNEFVAFLLDTDGLRDKPKERDMNAPEELNKKLLEKARQTHARIDAWTPPEDVELVQIIGIGNETEKAFEYYSTPVPTQLGTGSLVFHKPHHLKLKPRLSTHGDSEVVAEAGELKTGKVYYFDLRKLRDLEKRVVDHTNIFVEQEVLGTVLNIFRDESVNSEYITFTKNRENVQKIAVSAHSPVTISVRDSSGRTSSFTYNEASNIFEIEEEIPGSFVRGVGEAKYIFLPQDDYGVSVTGLDVGSFNLVLSDVGEDGKLETVQEFVQIPVRKNSVGNISIVGNSMSSLNLDLDANGVSEYTFSSGTSSKNIIKEQLENSLLALPIRKQLKSAIGEYFELWESDESADKRANYMQQIKRIIRFLNGRHITEDAAEEWTALAEHLQ